MPTDLPPPAAAFVKTVNAMVARQATLPHYLVYDTHVHVHSQGDADYALHYELDVTTGTFTLTVPGGPWPYERDRVYPVEPDFNALTDFYTDGEWLGGGRDNGRFANGVRPLALAASADAGAAAVRGYSVSYARASAPGDPLIHLELTASPELEAQRTVIRTVDIDPVTWLPVRVVLHTPFGHSTVTIDYTVISGVPLVTHYDIRKAVRMLYTMARYSTEATFENIVFDRERRAARKPLTTPPGP
jgi:hypothetical protein